MSVPSYSDEYKEAGQCFRQAFTLLFDIIKLFLTFNFVLGAIVAFVGKDKPLGESPEVVWSVALLGFVSGVGAIIIYRRVQKFANVALERASFIEKEAGKPPSSQQLSLYTKGVKTHQEKHPFFSASHTVLVLFASISILWLCFIIFGILHLAVSAWGPLF